MYQIIELTNRSIIIETESFSKAIEYFTSLTNGTLCYVVNNPFDDCKGFMLQKAEKIDMWERK